MNELGCLKQTVLLAPDVNVHFVLVLGGGTSGCHEVAVVLQAVVTLQQTGFGTPPARHWNCWLSPPGKEIVEPVRLGPLGVQKVLTTPAASTTLTVTELEVVDVGLGDGTTNGVGVLVGVLVGVIVGVGVGVGRRTTLATTFLSLVMTTEQEVAVGGDAVQLVQLVTCQVAGKLFTVTVPLKPLSSTSGAWGG